MNLAFNAKLLNITLLEENIWDYLQEDRRSQEA
jgi:hypothetical protein